MLRSSWFFPVTPGKYRYNTTLTDKALSVHILRNSFSNNNYLMLYEGWNFNSGNYLFTTDTK